MSRCENCPVASGPCVGEMAETDGLYLWACPAAAEGRMAEEIRAASGQAPPKSYPLPPPAVPAPPPTNPHQALLKLARACPHAGPASCGCNSVRRCARYNRDVAIGECLACVRDGGLETDDEPG